MLAIHSVTKSYGSRRVLDELSFRVLGGRLTGFVGRNGAGKTTAMRVILGVLAADSGHVTLDGEALNIETRRRFGYMPEERGLYPKMRVLEQIVYLGRLHGMTATAARTSGRSLLTRLGLGERLNDTVQSLSLGNQQRAQIAAALVHSPAVLVLDEPFSGLDPLAVDTVVSVLSEFAAGGAPVIFSSHQLDIVERLCDDLVVIADGQIRASGSRNALRAEHGGLRFELALDGSGLDWLAAVPGVSDLERIAPECDAPSSTAHVVFAVDSAATSQLVLREALTRGEVTRFLRHQPTLAQIFREVIR
ncbi:MAG: ATP-binding cassette domain-containing protein [Microbacteriaceae bacterium]|nr:ATP-binding cassette domain-containing protein [Microbacteriaceae bacterium]